MINKTIHYIWLGYKKKPENFNIVFNSWKKFAAEFEVKEWTEDNVSEFELPEYYWRSYNNKKYAFASDVLRVFILEKYGGVYLDIDQELLKPINTKELLDNTSFIAKFHQVDDYFGFGAIGSVPGSIFIKKLKDFYISYKGVNDIIINKIGSQIALELGAASSAEVTIFPQEYFYPLTGKDITSNTYGRHLANTSWIPTWKKCLQRLPFYGFFKGLIPKKFISRIDY